MTDTSVTRQVVHSRTDAPTALLHWALVITLIVSLLTGLRIASDAIDSTWARALDALLLQGSVTYWHTWAAYALSLVAAAYVVFLFRTRLQARVKLDAARLRAIGTGDRRARLQAVNVIIYWLAFVLIGIAAITGTLLYVDSALLPHTAVTTAHRIVAWAIIAYTVAHIAAQLAAGGVRQLLKILSPRIAYATAGAVALSVGGVAAAGVFGLDRATMQVLKVARVATPPVIDGNLSDEAWSAASVVDLHTVRGINFPESEVTVRVRAVRDEQNAYFLFEWPDANRSQKHLPLVKTEKGWKILEHRYGIQDENDYYEDKFGVMLATSSELAGAGSSHLGAHPVAGKPGSPNERGLHFTTDGSIVDVWHWKSVRTGPMAQLDDNYFGPPTEADADPKKRYTGGYTQDPKTGGGFAQNWKKLDDGAIEPLYLPRDPSLIADLQTADLDPNAIDRGQWSLALADTVPYSREADSYPIGAVLPSAIIDKPFEGDRGDVRGIGVWRDGWWRLEVTRRLDTASQFDVPIADGMYLWVAAFDHAQTRHTQHLHPLQLELE
jgi:cytochrome b subunit of formate dehydrogenase